ncbi:DUF2849 domain-containing protein [Parvibaculum sp.]|jgi:hypothetical protein|uniref:DUF2849 domain-containing protein n=1 Tax=Parvibaculum sp. TaxID=2024848 RepID=UPI000C4A93AC|nr:DUF2849 domain-containing protein [Parvibaculum sp.]HAC60126.1 DUF2849 domain-containing protein [Rhodobiaceae bacterium]MAU62256.1 hypothetical protein [Parvibaculum sp.]MBO6667148.1 DUF2849 domain-containing protein [Parvibaculum sp.]MBO6693072.1 DUF2849 domain-containing protein [Parvibaculum sp.]MBO6713701.1 DUF2849 domain-containing protein [Parvibaculum sp.]|tara:strand:- start:961 stop:1296 length:336 start_codon:yes stop_codon:yes gene_type:complete
MAQHTRKGAQFQALTANRLSDGIVVYLTREDRWSESLQDADVAEGKEAGEALLARAAPSVEANEVVEPYLFEVSLEDESVRAVSVRETIRQAGPTVRRDLGKQAELAGVHR